MNRRLFGAGAAMVLVLSACGGAGDGAGFGEPAEILVFADDFERIGPNLGPDWVSVTMNGAGSLRPAIHSGEACSAIRAVAAYGTPLSHPTVRVTCTFRFRAVGGEEVYVAADNDLIVDNGFWVAGVDGATGGLTLSEVIGGDGVSGPALGLAAGVEYVLDLLIDGNTLSVTLLDSRGTVLGHLRHTFAGFQLRYVGMAVARDNGGVEVCVDDYEVRAVS